MNYAVRLEQFEGPLELLLQLIEKQKLDITRVSLSVVTDQYLTYLAEQSNVPLSQLAQFLTVASRLLLLKSRALLPSLEFTEEEEQSIDELEWQLREYRKFREASLELGRWFEKHTHAWSRESFLGAERVFFSAPGVTVETLKDSFQAVLGEIPLLEKLEEEEIKKVVSLEDKMRDLQTTLTERMQLSFQQLTQDVTDKLEVIVAFLALLELVKQRNVRVEQSGCFQEIAMHHNAH